MPIEATDVPAEVIKVAAEGIIERAKSAAFGSPTLAAANELAISMPHRACYIDPNDLHPRAKLRDLVRFADWRFLIDANPDNSGDVPIAAVHVAMLEQYRITQFNEGSFVEGFAIAVRTAEQLDEVHKGSYEALFLVLPSLYVAALWLRERVERVKETDIVIGIPPCLDGWVVTPTPSDKFLDALLELRGKAHPVVAIAN